MERKSSPILTIGMSVLVGIIGYSFFYERDLGISVPIFVSLALAVMLGFAWFEGKTMHWRRLWLLVPILFFAAMFAVRANSIILAADALAVMLLGALMAHHLDGRFLDEFGWMQHIASVVLAGVSTFLGGFNEAGRLLKLFSTQKKIEQPNWLRSVLRGTFIALPILIVFAVLLSSADPIFQDRLLSITRWFNLEFKFDNVLEFLIITAVIAWLMLGVIVFASTPNQIQVDNAEENPVDKKTPRFLSLNMTEAGIVLGGVVLLFGFFVLIQFTYLFGQQEIFLENMTFADYARRGFFELVAVSVMTLGLMLSLDRVTLRRAQSQQVIFRLVSVLLVALTVVMLASAWRRMSLYEEAYGFSHLRLYTHVFMVWLGILLLVGLLDIFRVRAHIFTLGALLVMIGYLGTLNVINVDAYIAQHNIERYQAGEDLDICYFYNFSADAVPVVAEFYRGLDNDPAEEKITAWLSQQRLELDARMDDSPVLEANLSYQNASNILATLSLGHRDYSDCYYGYSD